MRIEACLLLAFLVTAAPFMAANGQDAHGPTLGATLRLTSLTEADFEFSMTFSGAAAAQVREYVDSSYAGGDGNGQVDEAEARAFEKQFRDNLDSDEEDNETDDDLTLDGVPYADPDFAQAAFTFDGFVGSDASSSAPLTIRGTLKTQLEGSPGPGPSHVLASPEGDENETEEDDTDFFSDGEIIVRVPPDYKITTVTGALAKKDDCEASSTDDDASGFELTFAEAPGSCTTGDAGGALPAAALAPTLLVLGAAAMLRRRRA